MEIRTFRDTNPYQFYNIFTYFLKDPKKYKRTKVHNNIQVYLKILNITKNTRNVKKYLKLKKST